jgi:succinyl-CoA synthetase alpha subunit
VNKNIFMAKNVIVQGITGSQGAFHTASMLTAGTNIIAGTSPNKAGQLVDGVPVFNTIIDVQKRFTVDCSVVFVPARFAKDALLEAIQAEIPLIVCITEGIPVHDMLVVMEKQKKSKSTIIGPNCPGVLLPGINKLGIIPANMGRPGTVGIVSRSGTLTYEAAAGLSARGIGQKYIIGIGGDRIRGIGFIECLELFEKDHDVDRIVLIGEVGGTSEQEAARYIAKYVTKPVYAYIAGHSAPAGVQLGHAGAILGNNNESALVKTDTLKAAGAIVKNSIVQLINTIR